MQPLDGDAADVPPTGSTVFLALGFGDDEMGDLSREVGNVFAPVRLDLVLDQGAHVIWRRRRQLWVRWTRLGWAGRRTVLETGQTAPQSLSLALGRVGAVGIAAAGLEGLELPAVLQRSEVEVVILHPQGPHGVDPAGGHGLDVGPFLGDVTVLGRVIVADDEVSDIGGQVVLVDAAHVGSALGNLALYVISVDADTRPGECGREGLFTYTLICLDIRAAEHQTMEWP